MIIKSMSRKSATFAQLIDYITTGQIDERFNVYQNVYERNYTSLKRAFKQNAQLLPRRRNGVYLYHEILSITRAKGISEQEQKELFCQMAQEYAEKRAGQNMVFAGMHDDKHHNLHYHLVISSNGVNDNKRFRMTKAEFSKFKIDFEKRVLADFPQLGQDMVIQRKAEKKLSNKAGEMKRRTGKVPERERVMQTLNEIFETSFSHQDFIQALDKAGFDFYIRGKNPGVLDRSNSCKYRLRTLGLLDQLEALDDGVQKKATAKMNKSNDEEEAVKKDPTKNTQAGETEKNLSDNKPSQKRQKDDQMESQQTKTVNREEQIQSQRKQEMKSRRGEDNSQKSSSQKKRDR